MEDKNVLKDKVLDKVVGGSSNEREYFVSYQCPKCEAIVPGGCYLESELRYAQSDAEKKTCPKCGCSYNFYEAKLL